MTISVTLAALGENVTQATVTRWLKSEGERVEAGEPLLEVSTDKVDAEIVAPEGGVLAVIKVAENESVGIGVELAVIDEAGGALAASRMPTSNAGGAAAPLVPIPVETVGCAVPAPSVGDVPAAPATSDAPSLRGQTVTLTHIRKVIADNMVKALQKSAQLTTVVEADVTGIMNLRAKAMEILRAQEGIKLSPMPFFIKAAAEALKAHPVVNASLDEAEGTITYHDVEHVGIAVDTERGMMVPVLHDVGELDIVSIAKGVDHLAARARNRNITLDDLPGATFTVTNTGSRGALFDTPIVTLPQAAILGVGAIVRRPVIAQSAELAPTIAFRDMVHLTLSYDHRIVDGADAARFLNTVKSRLEEVAWYSRLDGMPVTPADPVPPRPSAPFRNQVVGGRIGHAAAPHVPADSAFLADDEQ